MPEYTLNERNILQKYTQPKIKLKLLSRNKKLNKTTQNTKFGLTDIVSTQQISQTSKRGENYSKIKTIRTRVSPSKLEKVYDNRLDCFFNNGRSLVKSKQT